MTKIEMFELIKTRLTATEEIAFIEKEIELLQKKKNAPRKLTTQQTQNIALKNAITNFLRENYQKFTIAELQVEIEELNELSNQRISALLNQLVKTGEIKKDYEKRKAYFFIG